MTTPTSPVRQEQDRVGVLAAWGTHLLLLDAALETFWNGASMRWWFLALIAVYSGGFAVAWRRRALHLNAASLTSTALAVLLTAAVLSAWTPAGLSNGIRLFGLSTSTVLLITSVIAVGLAAAAFARLSLLPRIGHWAAMALAGYAISALVVAVFAGTPYAELFQGHSLWSRLPFWLQGAFLGAFVVVPAAILAEAFAQLKRQADPTTRWSRLTRLVALVLSFLIALPAAHTPGTIGSAPTVAHTGSAPPQSTSPLGRILTPLLEAERAFALTAVDVSVSSRQQVVERIDFLVNALRQEHAQIPRDTFDPDAVVNSTGKDAARLLAWVREQTRLVPYEGVLRGQTGVLLDRIGNSLDRSLLLADFLRRAGIDARLARAKLSPDRARTLLAQFQSNTRRPEVAPTEDSRRERAFFEAYAKTFGGNPESPIKTAQSLRAAALVTAREVRGLAETQSQTLMDLVRQKLASTVKSPEPAMLNALADHWWVQQHSGTDWIDLDPENLAGPSGADQLVAAESFAPSEIPEGLRHVLKIRVGIECTCSGRFEERTVLEHSLRLSESAGQTVLLGQIPFVRTAPPLSVLEGNDKLAALRAWLTAQTVWMPVLSLGPSSINGSTFDREGEVKASRDALGPPPAGGILDAFGGGETTPGRLTAEFIDYEIRAPGRTTRTERRFLFDWIGDPARRRSDAGAALSSKWDDGVPDLMTQTEILPLSAQPSREFVGHLNSAGTIASLETIRALVIDADRSVSENELSASAPVAAPPLELYRYALARHAWSPYQGQIFFSEANILTRHVGLRSSSGGTLSGWSAFDVVTNDVDTAITSASERTVLKVGQGVLDTHAELLLASAEGAATNIADIVMHRGSSESWSLRTSAEAALPASAGPGDSLIVTPANKGDGPATSGWWRIDPSTGTALGMTINGWGGTQAPTENSIINAQTAGRVIRYLLRFAMIVMCIAAVEIKYLAAEWIYEHDYSQTTTRPDSPRSLQVLCALGGLLNGLGILFASDLGVAVSVMGDMITVGVNGWSLYGVYENFQRIKSMPPIPPK